MGTGEDEKAFGREEVCEYIRQDIDEISTPFEINFTDGQAE